MQSTAISGLPVRAMSVTSRSTPFHAHIKPNRSMSGAQTLILIAAISSVSVALQAALLIAGVWPCAIFVAFDTLFLVCAIVVCQHRLQRHEEIVIDGASVKVVRCDRDTRTHVAREPLFGLTIEAVEDPDFGLLSLHLRNHRTRIEIARDLSPRERRGFLAAFMAAADEEGSRPRLAMTSLLTHPLASEVCP